MKNIFLAILITGCLISCDQTIKEKELEEVEQELEPDMEFKITFDGIETPAILDLKDVLKAYTKGKEITIQKEPLGDRTGQSFYISADIKNVVLKYTTPQSLENAIYSYLGMVGIHWYGAGINWLVKPEKLNKVKIAGEWKEPTFRNRIFAGTGGLDYGLSIDPNFEYKKDWYAWKRRNRFNEDFRDAGHVGDIFYLSNKEILDANPDWFSSYNNYQGKRYGRLKIDSFEAVKVFKEWAKKQYNPASEFNTIATDSEDGKGGYDDPLPADGFQGISNWNHADKWWWLTNETAKQFDENNDKIKVSALSYGDGPFNALVPKFKLRKNVYPIVTPYAFQTAYLPKQMIKTWAKTIEGSMGIYDYWNITQWSVGLPQFNIYSIPEKLSFWKQNKIDGMNIETTDAGGPMGHAWWLAGQLEWDLSKNIDTLFNQYLTDCFGAGSEPMKRMFNRWSLNYQYNQDVNFSLKDLKDATEAVEANSPQWKRINDLKAYVHFMKLMSQRNGKQSSNDSIYQYIYSIHNRMMVQTVAFTGQRYLGVAPEPLTAHQLTEEEIETNFAADLKELPIDYDISNFVFDYEKVTYTDSMPLDSWRFGRFAGGFFKAPFTGKLSIDIGAVGTTIASITTEDSVLIKEDITINALYGYTYETPYHKWRMKEYNIDIEKGKTYNVLATNGFSRVRINTAGIVLFLRPSPNNFDNFGFPTQYFYVPKGTKKIAYNDSEPQPMNGTGYLVTPDGILLARTATTAAGIYTVDVPEGQDGKVWTAKFGHTGWSFANIPNITSFQYFKYTE